VIRRACTCMPLWAGDGPRDEAEGGDGDGDGNEDGLGLGNGMGSQPPVGKHMTAALESGLRV